MKNNLWAKSLLITILIVSFWVVIFPLPAAAASTVTATDEDSLVGDHGDGVVNRGDKVRHTVTIENTGDDATGAVYSNTVDSNVTLVPGSLMTTPLAIDDHYSTPGTVSYSADAGSGLLVNDFDDGYPNIGAGGSLSVQTETKGATGGGTVSISADGSFTYAPPDPFPGGGFTVTFSYTVEDEDGYTDTANVTIIYDTAPTVDSTDPADGAANVPTDANISVTFSENMNVSGDWFSIVCSTSGTRSVSATAVTGSPAIFTINPNTDFSPNESCTVTVFAAQVSDQDANDPPDIMAADYTFTFTTDAQPSVMSISPANGSTNQATNVNLTVTFSEPVDVSGNWFQIVCGTSGTKNTADVAVTGGPTTFTINPITDFSPKESCTVTVFAAQVSDQDANDPPDTLVSNYIFSFTTDAQPVVSATTPVNAAVQVASNTNLTVTFSEPVDVSGNWFQIVCGTSGTKNTADVAVTGGPTTFTINPITDFSAGESCTVTIYAAQVSDQDSNDPPDNLSANYVFSFTIDAQPSVTGTSPASGATGVSKTANISITFSEPVSVSGAWFQIVCGSQTKNVADTAVTGGPTVFTIYPSTDLLPGNVCSVTVFAGQITDKDAGDPPDVMTANYVFSFSVPPEATSDNYTPAVIGNVGVNTANSTNFSILANDTPVTGVTINTSGTTAKGGTITLAGDGSGKFSYTPPAGYEGVDSFTYTIANAAGTSNTATVNLTVNGTIWFIDKNGSAGDGRLNTPFNSLAAFQAVNDGTGNHPAAGDKIFLYQNATAYTGPVTLLINQRLIGQDATATLATIAGVTVPADSFPLPVMNTGAPATTINSSSAGVNAVNLNSGNTVRGLTITTGSATSKGISGSNFGTLTASEVSISGSGPALDLTTGTLAATFDSISSVGGANGIKLASIAGTLLINGGTLSGNTGNAFDVSGGTAAITYGGAISVSAAGSRPVNIANMISSGGSVAFTGNVSANAGSGSAAGVNLDNNDGATIIFRGGLSLSTGSNTAFTASNGGTVEICDENPCDPAGAGILVNTLATTTGTALNVQNTNIGSNGLEFRSISAGSAGSVGSGPTSGIILNTTGSLGGLRIKGTGSAESGGIIQSAGTGVSLTGTRNVSLRYMRLSNFTDWAIRGSSVVNLTMDNVTINGTNGNSDARDEGSVRFTELTGSASVTNSSIGGGWEDNFAIVNTSGTLDRITFTNVTFSANSNDYGNDALSIEAQNTAAIKVTVTNSFFTSTRGDHIQINHTTGSPVTDLIFTGNTLTNSHTKTVGGAGGILITSGGSGSNPTATFNVSNNNISGSRGSAISIVKGGGGGTFTGTINNNIIGTVGTANSGSAEGSGISIILAETGALTATVTNNTIKQYNNYGIIMQTGGTGIAGSGSLKTVIQSNTISDPGTSGLIMNGIHLNGGTTFGDTYRICTTIGGPGGLANSLSGSGLNGGTDFHLRQRQLTTVYLAGYAGVNSDNAAVVTYVRNQNSAPTGLASNTVPSGGGFLSVCPF